MKRYDAPQNALSGRSRATERRDTPSRFADGGHHAQSRLLGARISVAHAGQVLRALLAGAQKALAQSPSSSGRRVERGRVRQRVEAREAEELLEQLGGAVHHRAEAGAARLLDQAALEQRADRRLGRHAADARDLRPRDRLEVGHDREALGLRLRQRRGTRAREQAPRGALGYRIGGEREAAGHLAQHDAAEALGVVLAQARQRLDDLALAHLAGVGEPLHGDRLGRQEEQRLDRASEVVHDGTTVIGPNGISCSHFASPAL